MHLESPQPRSRRRIDGGFTLVEVLVTVVVMALGLLGFAAMQSVALKGSRTALYRSYATFHAYDIADSMRVNRPSAIDGDYNLDFATAAVGGSIAGDDMSVWKAALADDLPGGQGKVTVDGQGNTTIEVRWNEPRWDQDTGSYVDGTLSFTTQTTL